MSWEEIERMPPKVRRKYIEIERSIPRGRKLEIAASFSGGMRRLVRNSIRSKHPDLSEENVRKEFARRELPPELRRRVYGW